ncbi:CLUMA_CG017759, isoform A [Clunio marinus]|uniref:Autophagy-related protein 13 n=1 Tax=Clunio marinus TaxID=568069 RepID=A0A1J1IX18_9DIPT|nr:CLUMA_CG017759, isoform A [Clunio marinus]
MDENNGEISKFVKFLAFKTTQIVVQSRLGGLICTKCNNSGTDWFNIAIQDHPEVLIETKKALQSSQNDSISGRLPLSVEISLQTTDGDRMVLEIWTLSLNPDLSDPALKATYTIYNRMSILLKSLISITRVTPAYKLSRRQAPESYGVYYRIYNGESQYNLGDSYRQIRIGQITTQIGTLSMSVAYRTKMTISPSQSGRDNAIMLKSDHFLKDQSPKHLRNPGNSKKNEKKVIDIEKPMKCGAFVDRSRIPQYTEQDYNLPENPPFSWLMRKPKSELEDKIEEEKVTNDENSSPNNNNNNTLSSRAVDATKLSQSPKDNVSGTSPSSLKSRWSMRENKDDDKLLKELHFPFANQSPIGDLAKFYRECFNAPPLESFTVETEPTFDQVENEVAVDDLAKQLAEFETSLNEFDGLLTSLCESENQGNN